MTLTIYSCRYGDTKQPMVLFTSPCPIAVRTDSFCKFIRTPRGPPPTLSRQTGSGCAPAAPTHMRIKCDDGRDGEFIGKKSLHSPRRWAIIAFALRGLRSPRGEMVGVAQLARAPDRGSGGRGFETHYPPHTIEYGPVAQLAEQGTLNPKVQGSNPCRSTIRFSERPLGRSFFISAIPPRTLSPLRLQRV